MKSDLGSVHGNDGATLIERVTRPLTFLARARGLIGRRALGADEGLWLDRCDSIHMIGMRFAIDVVFLRAGEVVRLCRGVRPLQLRWCPRADTALELAAGRIDSLGLRDHDRLEFRRAA
jgi:hypothetical protein